MRLLKVVLCGALVTAAGEPRLAADIGLGTQFTDAVIENLEPGGTYNLRELRGVPYSVNNVGDAEVEVEIAVVPPRQDDLKDGYEPIPDPNWVRLMPPRHRIPAKGMAFSDIVIAIPEDRQLVGRHFQADLRAQTVGTGLFGAGVKSRIRFSVGPGPESLAREKQRKAMVSMNFDIWPSALYVTNAAAGRKYETAKEEKKSVTVTNRSDKPMEIVLKAGKWNVVQFPLPEGYEAGDPSWLTFKPEHLKIKAFRVQEVKPTLNIPREQAGKKFVFVVQACLPIGTVVNAGNRVFVTVADGERP